MTTNPTGWVSNHCLSRPVESPITVTSADSGDSPVMCWPRRRRIPFLLSAVLVGIGLHVRLRVTESPLFELEVITGVATETPGRKHLSALWRPSRIPDRHAAGAGRHVRAARGPSPPRSSPPETVTPERLWATNCRPPPAAGSPRSSQPPLSPAPPPATDCCGSPSSPPSRP